MPATFALETLFPSKNDGLRKVFCRGCQAHTDFDTLRQLCVDCVKKEARGEDPYAHTGMSRERTQAQLYSGFPRPLGKKLAPCQALEQRP